MALMGRKRPVAGRGGNRQSVNNHEWTPRRTNERAPDSPRGRVTSEGHVYTARGLAFTERPFPALGTVLPCYAAKRKQK